MTETLKSPDAFGKYVSIIHRYARAFFDHKLADMSISSGHMPFVFHLSKKDGLSQDELSETVGMDKTTTARAIKSLVDLGYVMREHDTDDKRVYRLSLTSECKSLLPRIRRVIAEWNSAISHDLTPEEKTRLQQDLHRMSENARRFKENKFKELPERDCGAASA